MKNIIFYWSILFYNLIWDLLQHLFTGFVIIHHCPCGFDLVIHTGQPHWLYEREDDKRKKLWRLLPSVRVLAGLLCFQTYKTAQHVFGHVYFCVCATFRYFNAENPTSGAEVAAVLPSGRQRGSKVLPLADSLAFFFHQQISISTSDMKQTGKKVSRVRK